MNEFIFGFFLIIFGIDYILIRGGDKRKCKKKDVK